MINPIFRVIFLLFLISVFYVPDSFTDDSVVKTVYFKPIALGEYDRIAIVEASLNCGHFSDIRHIHEDWSIKLTRPINGVEKLRMEAGHGSSQLLNIKELDGVLSITKNSKESCFLISFTATIMIDAEVPKTVPLEIMLKP